MTPEQKLKIFKSMLRIRKVEERIDELYLNDEMKTPVHLYIGQEAIAVGVCEALNKDDYIQSNHRSHGHYLAKGGDLNKMMAELFCKSTGCSGAFGGSMHLIDKSVGHLGSSAIVAGGISIGTGLGLSIKLKKEKNVSVVFLGDGAAESGVFYESLMFAMLKKLPVIYILENNLLSVCSHITKRQVNGNVFIHGAKRNNLFTMQVDGNDPEAVYRIADIAVNRARSNQGPALIECYTYRVSGHAGCSKQDAVGYRDKREEAEWLKKCPIKKYRDKLYNNNVLTSEAEQAIKNDLDQEVNDAFEFARNSPLPPSGTLGKYLFCE